MPSHLGPPVEPDELWSAWNWDPLVWCALVAAALMYREAWVRTAASGRAVDRRQRGAFIAGMAVLFVALISPLDAMGASLASAHMVQHLLLTMVAAPLLVAAAPVALVVGSLPLSMRRRVGRWRASALGRAAARTLAEPVLAGAIYVVVLWGWHARVPYEAALEHHVVHGLEHVTFLATALLSWAAIFNATWRRSSGHGISVIVLFGLSAQCGLLGVLMTFAPSPWYSPYEVTAPDWGLSALADQQLAGVIMWVPAGGIYLVAALLLLSAWINPASSGSWRGKHPSSSPIRAGRTAERST